MTSDLVTDEGATIESDKVHTNKKNRVGATETEKELVLVMYLMRCIIIEVLCEL